MQLQYRIRTVHPDDPLELEAIIQVEAVCFPAAEAATPHSLAQRIAAFPQSFLVAQREDTGEIIGSAGVEPKFWNRKKTVVELGYIIDEKYRRQGYAYEACQGIIQESAKRGAVYLHCRIKSGNKASVNLAEKLGFQKMDYRLEDDGEDMEVWRYTC